MVMEVSCHKCMTMTSSAFLCHFFHVQVTLEGFSTNKSSPYMWPCITVVICDCSATLLCLCEHEKYRGLSNE
jgi:hypothetical protein